MSVVGSSIRTDRGIKESVRGQIGYLAADGYTKDTSTPSVVFVGDGVTTDSIGYKLSDILPSINSVTFNREIIGTLLFLGGR
jgi:hypothetical protein